MGRAVALRVGDRGERAADQPVGPHVALRREPERPADLAERGRGVLAPAAVEREHGGGAELDQVLVDNQHLIRLGSPAVLALDGRWGEHTATAFREVCRTLGLAPERDVRTYRLIGAALATPTDADATARPTRAPPSPRSCASGSRVHPAAGRRRTAARAGARPQGAQAEAAQGRARAGAPGGVQPPLRRLARAQADRRRRQGGPGDAEGRARDRQGPQGPRVPRDAAQALRHTRRRRAPARQPRAPRAAAVRGDRRRAPGRPDRDQHHGRHALAGQLPLPGTGGRLRRRRQPLQRRRPAALRRLPAPAGGATRPGWPS